MDHTATLRIVLQADPIRWHVLGLVQSLALPDCWIGAGFVRNAVWDHLHGRRPTPPSGDVDVLWFDAARRDPSRDRDLEVAIRSLDPTLNWSVKNQARMHTRNDDPPYASSTDAMRHWPETATAVAVRRTDRSHIEIAAPFGLNDLFARIVRPTLAFAGAKHPAFLDRVHKKDWLGVWPHLRLCL
jgi:hypothetical protein